MAREEDVQRIAKSYVRRLARDSTISRNNGRAESHWKHSDTLQDEFRELRRKSTYVKEAVRTGIELLRE